MKTNLKLQFAILIVYLFPFVLVAQSSWVEKDDMYFSKKDRAQLYSSSSYTTNSETTTYNSDYSSSHNFNSPTVQSTDAGSPTLQKVTDENAENNQYFIKDYSLPKEDNEKVVVNNYYGSHPYNNRFSTGITFSISFGSYFGTPYYGYYDPFFGYYDPFYRYYDHWSYAYYRYDPWRYYRYNRNRYYNGYYGGYYNSASCFYPTNGYTNYSSSVKNEVRYINGRKVINGSRTSRNVTRGTVAPTRGRTVKVSDASNPNGRSNSSKPNRNTYRKYPVSGQNSIQKGSNNGRGNRSNSFNRSNNSNRSSGFSKPSNNRRSNNNYRSNNNSRPTNRSSYNRNSNSSPRNNSSFRSSGSSGSRSTGISSGSRSGSSSGSKRSSGSRSRSRDN